MKNGCWNCRCFKPSAPNEAVSLDGRSPAELAPILGICRRRSPTSDHGWPQTTAAAWCAEILIDETYVNGQHQYMRG